MIRRIVLGVVLVVLLVLGGGYGALRWYAHASQDPAFFEDVIQGFEAENRADPPPEDVVIFTGSSSIRLWSSLAADMAPLPVVNRGFGGSQLDQVVHFAPRILTPHPASAIVVYAGDNDLAGGTGKTAETVVADFRELVRVVRSERPRVPIYYVTIKPSPLRFDRWPEMQRANRGIEAVCAEDRGLVLLDVASPMLGPDGQPRANLFRFDGLHLSAEGYALWRDVIRTRLLQDRPLERKSAGGPRGSAPAASPAPAHEETT